jgi:transposase
VDIYMIGIDLAKNIFQVHGVNTGHCCVLKKQLSRSKFIEFMANLKPCIVAMEACGGAHYWARTFSSQGHEVRMIAPQFVKPFVKSNKSDANDAEAIVEAALRPNMRFVGTKTIAQQELQFLHRTRQQLVKVRTSYINEMRGILREFGIVIPVGIGAVKKNYCLFKDHEKLGEVGRGILDDLYEKVLNLSEDILKYEKKIKALASANDICRRLQKINGIGFLTASAVVAATPDPDLFKNGRGFAAWLGLVPRHMGTGGKIITLGLSKKGDRYLKTLFIHGARAVLQIALKREKPEYERWKKLESRIGFNKTTVAIANRNARVVWKLMKTGEEYHIKSA